MHNSLWEQVADCFAHDDGSLPSVEITRLAPHEVSAIYALLRRRSHLVGDHSPEFWSKVQNASIAIESVDDPAALVASGLAEGFHFCVGGLSIAGTTLPVLGIFVLPDTIEIDYRMGPAWGPTEVEGFFKLLSDCAALAPTAVVRPAEFEGPPYSERFTKAWASYTQR